MKSRNELKRKKRQELLLLSKNKIIDECLDIYEISLQKTELILSLGGVYKGNERKRLK